MALGQYTKCTSPSNFNLDPHARRWLIAKYAAVMFAFGAAIVAPTGEWWCLVIVGEMAFFAGVIGYTDWFHFYRLICLGGDDNLKGDKECVGAIVTIENPDKRRYEFDWDTDFNIDILLQGTYQDNLGNNQDNDFGSLQDEVEQSLPYGYLIKSHPSVDALGLETEGRIKEEKRNMSPRKSATLHAEFEGDGNYILMLSATVALGLAFVALMACITLPPPWGLILALLSLLALVLGGFIGKYNAGSPQPNDVGGTGTLTDNDATGLGATVLYIRGTWVHDPLHDGWNEIHPVKVATICGIWDGDWATSVNCPIERIREGFNVAQAEETIANQVLQENQWDIHPDLDGCTREIVIE